MKINLTSYLDRLNPTLTFPPCGSIPAKRTVAAAQPAAARRPSQALDQLKSVLKDMRQVIDCMPQSRPDAAKLSSILQQRMRSYIVPTAADRLRELLKISRQYATQYTSAEQVAMDIIGTQIMQCGIHGLTDLALHTGVFNAMDQQTLLAHFEAADLGGETYSMATMAICGNIGMRAEALRNAGDAAVHAHFMHLFNLQDV